MMSLSCDKQADIIDAYNTTSRYLDDILTVSCWLGGLLGRVVSVVGFVEHFLNVIDDTVVWCLSSRLGFGLSCARGFRSLSSVVTRCIN